MLVAGALQSPGAKRSTFRNEDRQVTKNLSK